MSSWLGEMHELWLQLALCGVAGFGLAWLLGELRLRRWQAAWRGEAEERSRKREALLAEKLQAEERSRILDMQRTELEEGAAALREENTALHRKLAAACERLESQEQRLAERQDQLAKDKEELKVAFENLASRILDENSRKFVAKNQESMDKLLSPLGEKIVNFRERVEKTHEQNLRDRAALGEQIRQLAEVNRRMSDEARNLVTALKGQSKTQGSWGELILETVLEKSGLAAGQEYEAQKSVVGEDGRRYQPDVLVKLPEGKRLVIDSKASLVAYERCVNADGEAERQVRLREHVASMKAHVSELGKKRYDSLYEMASPDFVLMFVPVEAAFTLAMQAEDGLFDFAFRQNVVIVTPSTLLATLRTVANIWRQEKQTRNAFSIARKSGALYDKFVGFYEDLEQIGQRIGKSQEAYEAAMLKLRSGRGNLVRRVEELRELGARASKSLPESSQEEAELAFED